jgi:hypothetical protein
MQGTNRNREIYRAESAAPDSNSAALVCHDES